MPFLFQFSFCNLSQFLPQTFTDVGTCHEPGGRPFSTRTGALFPYQTGDKVTYTCDSCYTGGMTITCLNDGRWSSNVACEGVFHDDFFLLSSTVLTRKVVKNLSEKMCQIIFLRSGSKCCLFSKAMQ